MSDFWFPCYANDLLSSLRWKCMTPAQRGGYWQLICWQMQSDDGLLPGDLVALAALADLQLEGVLLDSFPLFEDSGKRGNPRAYREWLTRKDKTDKKREAGKKGSDIRWQKDGNTNGTPIGDANGDATVLPMHIYNQIQNHMENQKTENTLPQAEPAGVPGALDLPIEPPPAKRTGTIAGTIAARFEQFWSVVGKKVEKKATQAEFRRLNPDDELLVRMISAMKVYSQFRAIEYQKAPHRWIKGECWNDELQTGPAPGAPRKPEQKTDMQRALERMAREMVDE